MNQQLQPPTLAEQATPRGLDPRDLPTYHACVRDVVHGRLGCALYCHTHRAFGPIRDFAEVAALDQCIGSSVEVNNAIAQLFGLHVPQPTAEVAALVARTEAKG